MQRVIQAVILASKNKRLLLWAFMELWNNGKLAVADEIFAPEYVNYDPASLDFGTGPEGVKQTVTLYRNAFPDLLFTVEHTIETEQFITTRFTSRGTHKGDLRGIPATNSSIQVEGIVISPHFGWVHCGRVVWDTLGVMQQLGVIPTLEKVKAQGSK
jgi:predicted ester cyclase